VENLILLYVHLEYREVTRNMKGSSCHNAGPQIPQFQIIRGDLTINAMLGQKLINNGEMNSKDHYNYSTQNLLIFTSRCFVAASNGGCSPSSKFPICPRPQLPAHFSHLQLSTQSQSYFTTGGLPPFCSSWRQAP
jgi:hypothetical protein